jgi:hypothetical protein
VVGAQHRARNRRRCGGTWLLDGWLSFVVSLLLAALGFYVGFRAAFLVIERDHYGST